jgi:hypothetical protein
MKTFGKATLVLLFFVLIIYSGCDLQQVSSDPSQPRCAVSYTIIFNNTSDTTMHMGIDSQSGDSDLVQAGGSRNLPVETISLVTTAGAEEEHMVEMHVRSLDGQIYKYASYSILPKDWSPIVDPSDFSRATLSLQITCIYNGTDLAVSAIQL